MDAVYEQFANGIAQYGQEVTVGTGSLERQPSSLRFLITKPEASSYSNAQLDDYRGLARRHFLWRPPLKLAVRARFSAREPDLPGTAGFGFWNDPFLMTEARFPVLPRAVWFFYASPASNMKLDRQVDGYGWKAAILDASRPPALLWLPLAPLLIPLMNITAIYRRLWPRIQRILCIREARLHAEMTEWHTYMLEWGAEQSIFSLIADDDLQRQVILQAPSPRGPLGFVMWLDNQYLVVKPSGQLRWGCSASPGQHWMEVDWFNIEPLESASGRQGGL